MKRTESFAAAVFLAGTLGLASQAGAQNIRLDRTVTFSQLATAPGTESNTGGEYRQGPVEDADLKKLLRGSISSARVSSAHVPRPNPLAVDGAGSVTGFNGLTQAQQRLADGGNQFSIEPPDQGLAVGNGFVVEAVNLALRVDRVGGAPVGGVVSLNRFFFNESAIVRATATTPTRYGHFVSDPKAYFHAATGHWFVTVLSIDVNPATGALLGRSRVHVAVSQTADPTGGWRIYSIETTNGTGTTPGHAGCPCFGDQPLIGADANGFYITTNEFPIFVGGFNGAQVYAVSINDLENPAVAQPRMKAFDNLPLAEGPAYTLQPATAAPGVAYGGTAYFLSALDFTGTLDDRIAVWALSNTVWLSTGTGAALSLQSLVIKSQSYGQPPDAEQKPGPTPLRDLLKGLKIATEHLPLIAANDDRMQQVMFDGTNLWGALNTVVKPLNGPTRVGSAYFVVRPATTGGVLSATIARQGYVSVNNNSVLYPSVAVNASGAAAIGLTLVGPDYYPSAAYVRLSGSGAPNVVNVAAAGAGPEDGFTGYVSQADSRTARWGDYSAATVDEAGNLWFATEYIPALPRTQLANWGTYIGKITP
ncbi:MAG: hypothetical protein ABI818_10080 [Acidobacteriota bacterium]